MKCAWCGVHSAYQDGACRDCLFKSMLDCHATEHEGIGTHFETALMIMEMNSGAEKRIHRRICGAVLGVRK